MPYLFVHFRETPKPEGEQVHFGLSSDGFRWEAVNEGRPVLWSKLGEKGVRDFTIIRTKWGKFYLFATDLSLANCFLTKYKGDWANIGREGSKQLMYWESEDLVHWSGQKTLPLGEEFGCCWAPDVFFDDATGEYVLHWSSSRRDDDYRTKAIYYTKTKDFQQFSAPELLCRNPLGDYIDSCIVKHEGWYYRFLKAAPAPEQVVLEKGKTLTGEYVRLEAFDREMQRQNTGRLEGPTCYRLPDGRFCVMIDFFGCPRKEMRYEPFVAEHMEEGEFVRADGIGTYPFLKAEDENKSAPEEFAQGKFYFPYGFKHGTVMEITEEEYERIKGFDGWEAGCGANL